MLLLESWLEPGNTTILVQCLGLTVAQKIDFKTILLVYKSLQALAPKYISDMLEPYEPIWTENLREGSPAGAQSQD